MNRTIYGLAFILALLLAGSCSWKDEPVPSGPEENGTANLSLSFSTRVPGDDPEQVMNSLRVIIFRSSAAGIESGAPVINHLYEINAGATSIDVSEIVPVGHLNLYLVANEDPSMNVLGSLTSSDDLKTIVLNHPAAAGQPDYLAAPFVMYNAFQAVQIDTEGEITHPQAIVSNGKTHFQLLRTAAKVTVHLNCDFVNLGNRAIVLDSARIVSIPRTSRLVSRQSAGAGAGDFYTSADLDLGPLLLDKGGSGALSGLQTVEDGFTFYLPEHLLNPAERGYYTWLNLVGHLGNIRLSYRIPLGNGLGTAPNTAAYLVENYATVSPADLSITRNTHYTLDLDIQGFGEQDGIEVHVTAKPWLTTSIDGSNNGAYLNVSTVSTSISDVQTRRVYFWTNQNDIRVEAEGKLGEGAGETSFPVNQVFRSLSGDSPANFHFNPATGVGYFDVQIGDNAGTFSTTRHRIYLSAGYGLRREIEIFAGNTAPVPWNTLRWVGTFHRASEVGERIIYAGHSGAWTATVVYPTGMPGQFVVLGDRSGITDERLYTDDPGDPEEYPVEGTAQTVSGTGNILFRVGMVGPYTPSLAAPARYARIVLSHSGGTSNIYVRQGEGADYLMTTVTGSGQSSSLSQFSPYNLTAAEFKGSGTDALASVNVRPTNDLYAPSAAQFTDYPTQAGAHFQWAPADNGEPYAYNPGLPAISPAVNQNPIQSHENWDYLKWRYETCPTGYRRPNAGPTDGSALNDDISEWTNSIHYANSVSGYYADGFFDRRTIESSGGLVPSAASAVSVGNSAVAYAGKLVYNPMTLASLFFPYTGARQSGFALTSAGDRGTYWSATSFFSGDAYGLGAEFLAAGSQAFGMEQANTWFGAAVRCIQEDTYTLPQSVWVSPANPVKTLTVVSEGPWTLVTQPANATVSPTSGVNGTVITVTLDTSSTAYGGAAFMLRNDTSQQLTTSWVDYLYISQDDLLLSNNPGINTGDYEIFAWGGNEKVSLTGSRSNWLLTASISGGKDLQLTAEQALGDAGAREGYIEVAHFTDPDYKVQLPVFQDFYSIIRPFEFFVMKFTWPSSDIDISVEFRDDTGVVPFANTATDAVKRVGWNANGKIYLDGSYGSGAADQTDVENPASLMLWGGDATAGQGETVFFKSDRVTPPNPRLDEHPEWGRYLTLDAYASWYTNSTPLLTRPVRLSFYTYVGGKMLKVSDDNLYINNTTYYPADKMKIRAFNFYNVSEEVTTFNLAEPDGWKYLNAPDTVITRQNIVKYGASATAPGFRTTRTHVATIVYDRWTRGASVTWHAEEYTGTEVSPTRSIVEVADPPKE